MRASSRHRTDSNEPRQYDAHDAGCRGWLHMEDANHSRPRPHIERCDYCKRYCDDDSARRAHAKSCPDPLCVYGKTQAARNMKAAINDAVDAINDTEVK